MGASGNGATNYSASLATPIIPSSNQIGVLVHSSHQTQGCAKKKEELCEQSLVE